MTATPTRQTRVASLDHLVRPRQQGRWDGEPKCLGSIEVDHQLKRCGLLDGKIHDPSPFEDLVYFERSHAGTRQVGLMRTT